MNRNRLFHSALYVLIFLNLFFLSSIFAYHVVIKGELVTVPGLTGKTVDDARAELARKRLNLAKKGEQFDTSRERGTIIAQEPPPGSKVKFNEVVRVILSSGKEKVIVPRLKGRNFQLIGNILDESGVARGLMSHVHTLRYPAGSIIAQYPLPGEEVGRGTAMSLLISEGGRETKYLMADLIGKKTETVIPRLRELGFRVEDVRNIDYPGLESGIIIRQNPRHGYVIQKNFPITLEVSR